MLQQGVVGSRATADVVTSRLTAVFAALSTPPLSVLAFGEWIHSPELHQVGEPRPVCVVFSAFERDVLHSLGASLRDLWRSSQVEPMFVLSSDVATIADSFPIKVLELRDRSRVVYGANPFAGIEVDREHVRLRLEQETRNHLIRMRRQWLFHADEPGRLFHTLKRSCVAFEQQLGTLSLLRNASELSFAALPRVPADTEDLRRSLNMNAQLFAELTEFHRHGEVQDVEPLFFRHLELLERLAEGVDQLRTGP